MGLETGSFIPDLVDTNPAGTDPKSEGDDHLRLLKTCTQGSFPAFVGTIAVPAFVSLTEDEINDAALKSAIQTITAEWTHEAPIILANQIPLVSRNAADDADIGLVSMDNLDRTTFGDVNSQQINQCATQNQFLVDGVTAGFMASLSAGGVVVRDLNSVSKKAGFRNPGIVTIAGDFATQDFEQSQEGQHYRITGNDVVMTLVPLEAGTIIRLLVGGAASRMSVDSVGVTMRWQQGGSSEQGTVNVGQSSVVDFYWRDSTNVDFWGNGLST